MWPAFGTLNSGVAGKIFFVGLLLFCANLETEAQSYRFFSFPPSRADFGTNPSGSLVEDQAGNFYVPTGGGNGTYYGTIVEITNAGKPSVLHKFEDQGDGGAPLGTPALDRSKNLYVEGSGVNGLEECGLILKIDPLKNATVLYTFQCGADGDSPQGGLIADASGNLYGVTQSGGGGSCPGGLGCGTVFRIDPSGNETVLYRFQGGTDGFYPQARLVADRNGNLYGTTKDGGTVSNCSCGTVFRIDPSGNETILYSFQGGADGAFPYSSLIFDSAGNLYGTTSGFFGDGSDVGTVFKIDPAGHETVIYRFTGGADGGWPMAGLVMDSAGNLFGTTSIGGEIPCGNSFFAEGCGTVFKVDQIGNLTTLHTFHETDGADPSAELLRDAAGALYGDTFYGGSGNCRDKKIQIGCGVLFRLKP